MSASNPTALVPNHHADHPSFSGLSGLLAGLSMIPGRGSQARLVADLASVGEGDRVVDVGCGPGAVAREAARRGATVVGVDPAPVMLDLARRLTRGSKPITWAEGAAEALPLSSGSATVVWSVAAVHHWPDLEGGLAEAHRVLEPGGRFIAVERRSAPGATGHASHGWTEDQAAICAERCIEAGFAESDVEQVAAGRTQVLVVRAIRGDGEK